MQPSQQGLWVPHNQPSQDRRFSLIAWIAGHAGIAILAQWAGLIFFGLGHFLIGSGADEGLLN